MKIKLFLLLLLLFTDAAFATPTTPTSDFIDNHDGTVTHKTTGLTWMRCAMGQTWKGSKCSGIASLYTYAKAKILTTTFAGLSDWRLPNIAELHTIVERENLSPAINTAVFPNVSNESWSSTPLVRYSFGAWFVNFNIGYDSLDYNHSSYSVRLVRGGQQTFDSLPYTTPTSDFTDHRDGTVTHQRTGLMWQRCAVGQVWIGSTCSGTTKNYTYAKAKLLTTDFAGFSDWRLPNQNELLSIVEYGSDDPAINSDIFPNTVSRWFWSSSPYVNNSNYAWGVYFSYGAGSYSKKYGGSVRLVRKDRLMVLFQILPSQLMPPPILFS